MANSAVTEWKQKCLSRRAAGITRLQIKESSEDGKLTGVAFAQHLDWRGHFLLTDAFVLLPLGSGLQPLPRQRAQIEIHEDVSQRLKVIAPRLLCGDNERK